MSGNSSDRKSEMIGIVTRYRKHDSTFAALSLAKRLGETGRRHTLIRYDWRTCAVDAAYDHRVKRSSFMSWLDKVRHVVWTAPADEYFIEEAKRRGIRSTLYTSWEQLEPYDEGVLGAFSQVLVPTMTQALQLKDRFGLRNVAVMPYDCGLPVTRKTQNDSPGMIKLFLSLYGAQRNRVDQAALMMLADVVRDREDVAVTIADSKGLTPVTMKSLKRHSKAFGARWRVLPNADWHEHTIEMARHDITIWPARSDGFGLIGKTSLHVGTPVLAWDVAPMSEHLLAGRNAILVSCDLTYDWLGVPTVSPDYAEFDRILRWLLATPEALAELRRHTHEKLAEQQATCRKGWDAILPAA
jgi:hypothetical protein